MINVSVIKHHYRNKFTQATIPHIDEDITEYEVEHITGERKEGQEFKVKWAEYAKKTWKPFHHLKNAKSAITIWKTRTNPSVTSRDDQ